MSNNPAPKTTPMTPPAQARIHSAEAKAGGGQVKANSFTARAQRTISTSPQAVAKGRSK